MDVSDIRDRSRFESSIALVETMVEHILAHYTCIDHYGLKRKHPSYEVWVEYNDTRRTVQSLTREIIVSCTDPDEDTARQFQAFIERGIRQGMQAVMTESQ
jgi:hypothetical protein